MARTARVPLPIGTDGLTYYQRYYRKHMKKRQGEALARWKVKWNRMSPEAHARYNASKRECHRERMKDPAYREKRRAECRQYYQENKDQYRARNARNARTQKQYARMALHYAILADIVRRAPTCLQCSVATKTHAHHHKGYEGMNAFDVQWLCRLCHGVAHRKYA